MKLKKIASLMLAGIMAVSMLAGCNGEPTPDPDNNGNGGVTVTGHSVDMGKALKDLACIKDKDYITFADNAAPTLVATAVPKDGLGVANSRLFATSIVGNQLAGPPLGAFLFGVGLAVPFGVNALCFLLAAVLVSRISTPVVERAGEPRAMRHEIAEGLLYSLLQPTLGTITPLLIDGHCPVDSTSGSNATNTYAITTVSNSHASPPAPPRNRRCH